MLRAISRSVIDPDYTSALPWRDAFTMTLDEHDTYDAIEEYTYLKWKFDRASTINNNLKEIIG